MIIQTWTESTVAALQNAWIGFVSFMPQLIGALLIMVVGWFISVGLGKLVTKLLGLLKLNQLLEKWGWKEALARADFKVDAAGFIGGIFQWALFLVFLIAAADTLNLPQFSSFLGRVLGYVGNIIIAAFIFVAAAIIADILEKIVVASVEKTRMANSRTIGHLAKWAVWIFAISIILLQLGVAPSLINTLVMGLVGMFAIAGGLAFGLGGKDLAADILAGLKRKLS